MSSQCSIYHRPDKSFSSNSKTCRHPTIGAHRFKPQPNRQFDHRTAIQPTSSPYFHFSIPRSTDSLNQRHQHSFESSVFPRNIYTHHPFGGSVSYAIHPRDKSIHYTYSPNPEDGKERSEHTEWFSRFGYDRFHNEYGVGAQSRGYIEPPECDSYIDIPSNMAPERFYTYEHLKGNPTEFKKALEDYR